jgi:hypothetical protein
MANPRLYWAAYWAIKRPKMHRGTVSAALEAVFGKLPARLVSLSVDQSGNYGRPTAIGMRYYRRRYQRSI